MNPAYLHALRQIDELIAHFRSGEAVSCAVAEQEDQILIRLGSLKDTLKPEDTQAIEHINRYYQRHIRHEHHD